MIADLNQIYRNCDAAHIGDDLILLSNLSRLPIPTEPRRSEHIIVALCLHGKAQFSVDTKERIVKEGDLIIIQRDRVTDNYMLSSDLRGIAMIWSKEFFDELVKDMHELRSLFLFSRIHAVVRLTPEEIEDIVAIFSFVKMKVLDKTNKFRQELIRSLITAGIYTVCNAIFREQATLMNNKTSRAEEIFMQFITLVEENFRQERRVMWYAEQLNITSKYLSETVKQASQQTPNVWIDNYVMLEIRVLLRNTSKSIKEITEDLNFPTQSFLGKYFKERMGISPKEYRKKHTRE